LFTSAVRLFSASVQRRISQLRPNDEQTGN
jgi:hypothetical protein